MEAVGGHALSRRRALALLGSAATAVAATSCASHTSDAQPSGATPPDAYELSGDVDGYATTLILLGTAAGPIAVPGRSGTSSVLVVGDRPYLIDAGPWSSRKLIQAGIAADSLGGVFVTHLHSDHIADLVNVFWLPGGTPSYTFRDAGSARPGLSLAGVPVRHGGRCGHVLRRHREVAERGSTRPRIRHPRPRGDRRRLLRADFGSRTGRAHDSGAHHRAGRRARRHGRGCPPGGALPHRAGRPPAGHRRPVGTRREVHVRRHRDSRARSRPDRRRATTVVPLLARRILRAAAVPRRLDVTTP
ncbi:MBL fold metallo-hydrolase [Rhodococcus jostii]|uniref:MBL fold metallo-hydrolase n=1 Tax=Rhodococcus jostii TaxID=132919 RepID=UPI0009D70E34